MGGDGQDGVPVLQERSRKFLGRQQRQLEHPGLVRHALLTAAVGDPEGALRHPEDGVVGFAEEVLPPHGDLKPAAWPGEGEQRLTHGFSFR